MGYQYFLSYGAPCAHAPKARSELRENYYFVNSTVNAPVKVERD